MIALLVLIFSCNAQEKKGHDIHITNRLGNNYNNFLIGKIWETDAILGESSLIDTYQLKKFIQRRFAGNLTIFTDTLSFTSKYVAPCGNDNFTTVTGNYKFISPMKIEVIVKTMTYSGEWNRPTVQLSPKKLIYIISKSKNKLIFTKEKV